MLTQAQLRGELVELWTADLNQRESEGPNRSPMIDSINKRLGVPLGSPYCIGGLLVRGVEVLCKRHDLVNPVPMKAGTQSFWRAVPDRFKTPRGGFARKGDIGILQNVTDKAHGHAFGFREDETPKGQLTIEYNTNLAGSRNGDGVYQLDRKQSGTSTKTYLGSIDVIAMIIAQNPEKTTV